MHKKIIRSFIFLALICGLVFNAQLSLAEDTTLLSPNDKPAQEDNIPAAASVETVPSTPDATEVTIEATIEEPAKSTAVKKTSPKSFKPSEEISEDLSVPFPADI